MITHDDGSVTLTKKEYEELLEGRIEFFEVICP